MNVLTMGSIVPLNRFAYCPRTRKEVENSIIRGETERCHQTLKDLIILGI